MSTEKTAKEIYEFLNEPIPITLKEHLYNQTHTTAKEKITSESFNRANSTHTALAWRNRRLGAKRSYLTLVRVADRIL